jgi:hypothetical protein
MNNVRIAAFPEVLIAARYGFNEAAFLRFDAHEKADVDMKSLFAN